ncbi:hypothetical protein AAIH46_12785 [Rhizobium sp. 0TCS1.26]|uniref:hypothetical protein n=1 Tax=Rhizobium sp. 0TCS1.26 TaxID=3142623 RepID=UPI003D26DC8E
MHHVDTHFYPSILAPGDLTAMETAIRSVISSCNSEGCSPDAHQVARFVLRLYRMGLTDVEKLSTLGAQMMRKPGSIGQS